VIVPLFNGMAQRLNQLGQNPKFVLYAAIDKGNMAAIPSRSNGPPAPPAGTAIAVNAASYRADQGIAPGSLAVAFGAFSAVPDNVLVSETASQIIAAAASQVTFIVPQATSPARVRYPYKPRDRRSPPEPYRSSPPAPASSFSNPPTYSTPELSALASRA
jgi:hypothetical protein